MVIEGDEARETIERYLRAVAPDLLERVEAYEGERDSFDEFRISEQIEKALDRKVWLPSGGSLVIDRTEAMTVVDVNTGKFVGSGGNLEETVTKNNLEAAEEIVRQLRLRDIGGIIVVDFIDMVLESNRDLVLRRLVECLSRDRTKHQVAEVTSLGLVQMTRKKLGLGLLESFSEPCEVCAGRGIIVHHEPIVKHRPPQQRAPSAAAVAAATAAASSSRSRRRRAQGPHRHARDHRGREARARADRRVDDPAHRAQAGRADARPRPSRRPSSPPRPATPAVRRRPTPAQAGPQASSGGRRRGRHRRVTQEQGPRRGAEPAAPRPSRRRSRAAKPRRGSRCVPRSPILDLPAAAAAASAAGRASPRPRCCSTPCSTRCRRRRRPARAARAAVGCRPPR